MRPKSPRMVSLFLLVAAVAIGAVLGAQRNERPVVPGTGDVAGETTASKSAKAKSAHVRRGPRGRRGKRGRRGRPGRRGPVGERGGDAITDLSINWRGGAWTGRDSAQATLTGIGTVTASCRPINGNENGQRRLVLTPDASGVRTVLNVSVVQASEIETTRYTSESTASPIQLDLPVNGMISAVASREPVSGDGGPGPSPWTIQASSETKLNGPGGEGSAENFCYVALQAARGE